MQPFPKTGSTSIGKIGDIVLDPSKTKIDPNILKGLFPPTCGSTFADHFAVIKKQTVAATLAILPNNNDTLNNPSLGDTPVTFKAKDSALATMLTDWHPDLKAPNITVAYATFSKVLYMNGSAHDAILCIVSASAKVHRLFLKRPDGEHVWYSDITMTYCKKDKLYLLNSDGYTLSVDFGL